MITINWNMIQGIKMYIQLLYKSNKSALNKHITTSWIRTKLSVLEFKEFSSGYIFINLMALNICTRHTMDVKIAKLIV